MTTGSAHRAAGTVASDVYPVDIAPPDAGWEFCALRILQLPPRGTHSFATGGSEWILLPLAGGAAVTVDGEEFTLHGRESVFTGVSDFLYAPRAAEVTVRAPAGAGVRLALAGARCTERLPARYRPASSVGVELRGAGACSRQVNNFAAADVFAADRLIAVEVLTPGGNWSSYPPHKHDEFRAEQESELEEIYYFEIAGDGFGYQRVTPSGHGTGTELLAEVRTGDVVLIPDGWHGPSIAAPGHDMYYLNVMAGPGTERAWRITDHPDHAWIRDRWRDEATDPRLPFYRAPRTTEAPEVAPR
ncbi:5-deoxy-glucuronate isomerase [Streptomyces harbinensis]|uniref:5-deoxy-glucuronate isomerase n=1 Tax=Streptomyces harbinensis TaxID=1176198 RepID=UPI003716F76F